MAAALTIAVRWLLPALAASGLLLAFPSPGGSLGWVMMHLAAVVVFGLFLTMALGGYHTMKRPARAMIAPEITSRRRPSIRIRPTSALRPPATRTVIPVTTIAIPNHFAVR